MNILVLGSGGREHALLWKIKNSKRANKLFIAPGNAGTASLAENVPLQADDIKGIVRFCLERKIQFVVVGPEVPLAMGVVDTLGKVGIRAFGPSQAAAQLEASKSFAKEAMREFGIPTADFAVFDGLEPAITYVRGNPFGSSGFVIKADGLAAGKGVTVCDDLAQAETALQECFGGAFGAAGNRVVIEERLFGREVSVLAFCDGKVTLPMIPARDHKRALDNDEGANTGGMGAFAPTPDISASFIQEVKKTVLEPVMNGMAARGTPYKGILYAGLMLTDQGFKVIEFNCRFGDPEAQVVLPLLETDLVDVLDACVASTLSLYQLKWKPGSCATIVMASPGYPASYPKGLEISGLERVPDGVTVFHAGTKELDGKVVTDGGRVLNVTASGATLEDALVLAYSGVTRIQFDGAHYRSDIGRSTLEGTITTSSQPKVAAEAPIVVPQAVKAEPPMPIASSSDVSSANVSNTNASSSNILNTPTAIALGRGGLRGSVPKVESDLQNDAVVGATLMVAPTELPSAFEVPAVKAVSTANFELPKPRAPSLETDPLSVPPVAISFESFAPIAPSSAPSSAELVVEALADEPTQAMATLESLESESSDALLNKVMVDDNEDFQLEIMEPESVEVVLPSTAQSKTQVDIQIELDEPNEPSELSDASKNPVVQPVDAYKAAGVNIAEGTRAVELMKDAVKSTHDARVLAGVGAFGGMLDVSGLKSLNQPVLVASTDGVGTKTMIAAQLGRWEGIGMDIVNHGINDILAQGAKPLFFMDYVAASQLRAEWVATVVASMARACKAASCVVLGGETAEMPGVYRDGESDVVGTIVGVLDRENAITGERIKIGDAILALPSSGLHTNGYSLARRALEGLDWLESRADLNGRSIGEALLMPHRSYLPHFNKLIEAGIDVRGLAHITGGGLWDNVPRVLPQSVSAAFKRGTWRVPPIFTLITSRAKLEEREQFHAFNMGIGMVVVLPKDQAQTALFALEGEAFLVGEIRDQRDGERVVLE